jgi:Protein of unknown function (DUF4238)
LKKFQARTKSVCRITDHNTNPFLQQPREIEEFLKNVEPKYDVSLDKIREDKIDQECIHCIAGFAAYVLTCSPAALRLNVEPISAAVGAMARAADAKGVFDKSPPSLGSKSVTEHLDEGSISPKVEPKFPQAIGINSILQHVSTFGNSPWEILRNFQPDTPFVTSDFPVALEVSEFGTSANRIVPLAPDIAIRIRPDIGLRGQAQDLKFGKFTSTRSALKRHEVVYLNRLIVQSAEELVFYSEEWWWVDPFVTKNHRHYVENVNRAIEVGGKKGFQVTSQIGLRPK